MLFSSPIGNPRRITANSSSTGQALFCCPWSDAVKFEIDTLGYSEYVSGLKYLKRRLPLRHGDPAQQTLFCDTLEAIHFHNFEKAYHEVCTTADGPYSTGWPKTEMRAYKGTFSEDEFYRLEDAAVQSAAVPELKRYLTRFSETESFHRKIPGYGFAFESDVNNCCTVLASLPEFCVRWIFTTYQWPYPASIPEDYIARTLGCVNSDVFDTDTVLTLDNGSTVNGFPVETLRYEDCRKTKPYAGSDGEFYVDIQHLFLWNPRGWQKQLNPALDPDTSPHFGYETIQQRNATGAFYSPARYSYRTRNFAKLFKPRGAP